MLVADLVDVLLSMIKFCHCDKVIRVVWISWVDYVSFSRERPLSTQHMYHHHTIGEDVNLWGGGGGGGGGLHLSIFFGYAHPCLFYSLVNKTPIPQLWMYTYCITSARIEGLRILDTISWHRGMLCHVKSMQ